MNSSTSNVAKAIGAGIALSGAIAVMSTSVSGNSMKRKIKKTAKKAGDALTNMVSNAQYMMK